MNQLIIQLLEDLSFMEGCSLKDIIDETLDKHTCKCNKAKEPIICELEGHVSTKLEVCQAIIFEPYTILFYIDDVGNKDYTISKCADVDEFDKHIGIKLCALKATKKMIEKEIATF